jgi:hypothetical protein
MEASSENTGEDEGGVWVLRWRPPRAGLGDGGIWCRRRDDGEPELEPEPEPEAEARRPDSGGG